MTITIKNQKPVLIYNPDHSLHPIDPYTSDSDYDDAINATYESRLVGPLFDEAVPGVPVTITDDTTQKDLTSADITEAIMELWVRQQIDPDKDTQLNEIYRQSLRYHQSNNWLVEQQLAIEAMSSLSPMLPVPDTTSKRTIVYTPQTDLIPAAKALRLNQSHSEKASWFGSLAGYLYPRSIQTETLIVSFISDAAFGQFKQTAQNAIQQSGQTLSPDTQKALSQFWNLPLDQLSQTLMLGNDTLSNSAGSFKRILVNALGLFEHTNPSLLMTQPLFANALYNPSNVIFLNLESYSHATNNEIKQDWDDIEKALHIAKKLKITSNKSIKTAKSITQQFNKNFKTNKGRQPKTTLRIKQRVFSGKPISAKNLIQMMALVIKKNITNKQTQNQYKTIKTTYQKGNRRNPNDPNLMGKLTTTKYRPDIHIYLDTSGSISETQYRDAVMSIILLSSKIEADLFFTSFSHTISQTSLIRTKNRRPSQIYTDFLNIPKVGGGTDYANVWRKIEELDKLNEKSGKSHQLNFIISDFEYTPPRGFKFKAKSPCIENTYYAPISVDPQSWKYLLKHAESFAKSMLLTNDTNIKSRMLL